MAKLCPFNTFVDANGDPLAGGLIYTYVTGTSTPKATFTDSVGTTELPNPVVLGSNGRKEIWLSTDQAYKFIIKDSGGTQIGNTIDGITPVTSFAAIAGAQDIDVTGYAVITTGSADLNLTPDTGHVVIDGVQFPNSAGTTGQVLALSSPTVAAWTNGGVTNLDAIPDVDITSVSNGQYLKYNSGTGNWVNGSLSGNISSFTNDSGYLTSGTQSAFTTIAVSGQSNVVADSNADTLTLVAGTGITLTTDNTADSVTIANSVTVPSAATQAEMESASSNTVYATPGRVQNHPGVAKVWAFFTMNGTGPVLEVTGNYNVASTTSLGSSQFRVDFTTAFADTNYAVILRYYGEDGTATSVNVVSRATGSVTLGFSATTTGKKYDMVIFGDQ